MKRFSRRNSPCYPINPIFAITIRRYVSPGGAGMQTTISKYWLLHTETRLRIWERAVKRTRARARASRVPALEFCELISRKDGKNISIWSRDTARCGIRVPCVYIYRAIMRVVSEVMRAHTRCAGVFTGVNMYVNQGRFVWTYQILH